MQESLQKAKRTGWLLLISALFFATSFINIPVTDKLAENYFSESIKATTIAYATTRGVNAVVSVVKESQLELAPAGVGISIAAGQILDPIDDMTERLSSVLVAAIASLGIQKIGFEISSAITFKLLAIILLLLIPAIWLNIPAYQPIVQLMLKFSLVLLLLRFLLPVSALASHALYEHWLQPGIDSSLEKLSLISSSYDDMSSLQPEQSEGFFSSMTGSAADKVAKTKEAFLKLVNHAEDIISSLLSLITVYIALFVVQTLLLPLFMLWLLLTLLKSPGLTGWADSMLAQAGIRFRSTQA